MEASIRETAVLIFHSARFRLDHRLDRVSGVVEHVPIRSSERELRILLAGEIAVCPVLSVRLPKPRIVQPNSNAWVFGNEFAFEVHQRQRHLALDQIPGFVPNIIPISKVDQG